MHRKLLTPVLSLCLLLLAPAAAHCQSQLSRLEGIKLDVAVHELPAYQLLFEIAEITNTNWVVGRDLLQNKVSINAKQMDAAALVRQLLAADKLHTLTHHQIDVVLDQCRLNSGLGAKATLPPVKKPGPINIHFSAVDFSTVVSVMADFSKLKLTARAENQNILVRTREQPWTDVLRATLMAEDMAMLPTTKGAGEPTRWAAHWPQTYACPKPVGKPVKTDAKKFSVEDDGCKRRKLNPQSQVPCGSLEYFKSDALIAKGYIALSDTSATPYVLLQTPDEKVFRIKLGDYEFVGDQLGQVISADHDKVSIEEFVFEGGQTYLQTTQIAYTGARQVVEKKLFKRSAPAQ